MDISIAPEPADSADAVILINELQDYLAGLYPPTSLHGYSISRLVTEEVAYFILRADHRPAGCGGLKIYPDYSEIKRVYVRPEFRGYGFGRILMQHLEAYSREQGRELIRLETGIYQPEAVGLYERMGYQKIQPFGEYEFDPLSLYFEKSLAPTGRLPFNA